MQAAAALRLMEGEEESADALREVRDEDCEVEPPEPPFDHDAAAAIVIIASLRVVVQDALCLGILGILGVVGGTASVGLEQLPVKHIPGPQGVHGRNSDNTLIKASIGWAPSISIKDGLKVGPP